MIYIVIPVHNRIAATLECLACLRQQTYRDFKIIVVDDGSTDHTDQAITTHYPEVTLLKGNGNLWWTGAMYLGIETVLQTAHATDDVLSLNNDVTFEPDYLEKIKKVSQQYHRAIVGSLCKDVLDKNVILDSGIQLNWHRYTYSQLPYDPKKIVATAVDTISGRGLLIPIPVINKIGNFSKKLFPHYGADYDYGLRAKTAGIPLVISYQAVVYLKNDLSGFIPTHKILSLVESWKKLFSIQSPANLIVRIKTIYLHCPLGPLHTFWLIGYMLLGNGYVVLRDTLLYTLIKLRLVVND